MRKPTRRQIARGFAGLTAKHSTGELSQALAEILREYKMQDEVDLLLEDINQELLAQTGHVQATLRSARPVAQDIKDRIRALIMSESGAREVSFEEIIEPELIGGFIAQAGDLQIDSSLRNTLNQMRG